MKVLTILLFLAIPACAQAPSRDPRPPRPSIERGVVLRVSNYASGARFISPNSLARITGQLFTRELLTGNLVDPPYELGGITVSVDNMPAKVRSVQPGVIVILVPDLEVSERENWDVEVVVRTPENEYRQPTQLARTSPGLFKQDSNSPDPWPFGWYRVGLGVPVMIGSNEVPLPGDEPVVISLVGTGWRHAEKHTLVIGSYVIPARTMGTYGGFAGMDQVGFELPAGFHARGVTQCVLIADGIVSNVVWVRFPE